MTEDEEVIQEPGPIEELDPEVLFEILTQNQVVVPLQVQREDVRKIKAVKVSDKELERINNFQSYLYRHPCGYIPEDSFASLFVYIFNLAFTLHKEASEHEAKGR